VGARPFYPLVAYICRDCLLVQLQEYVSPKEIFSECAYFSAYSDTWLDHAWRYVDVEAMSKRLDLGPFSRVRCTYFETTCHWGHAEINELSKGTIARHDRKAFGSATVAIRAVASAVQMDTWSWIFLA
jgi:Putative zinc binding domain